MNRIFLPLLILAGLVVLTSFGFAESQIGSVASEGLAGTTLTLVSNTDQCLVDCEAWLEWNLSDSDVLLPRNQNSSFNIDFVKKTWYSGLRDWGIEVYEMDSKTGILEKVSDNLFGFKARKNQKYFIRIWGKMNPGLGAPGIDWQITLFGTKVAKWSWWDSDWLYYRPVQIRALADLNAGYPIDVNHAQFDFGGCFTDGNCQADMDDVRIVCADVEYGRHYEDDNSTDFNAIWFELPGNVASGNVFDCNIFFGNPSATYTDTTNFNLIATDSETRIYYRMEDNADNNIVFDYADYNGDNPDGISGNKTNTMDIAGVWKNGLDFKSASSDFVSFPNPTYPEGTMEFFIKLDAAIGAGGYTIAGITNAAGKDWEISAIVAAVADCGVATCWRVGWGSDGGTANWTMNMVGYPLRRNQWYHVAVTWGGTASIYIDNNLFVTTAGGTLGDPGDRPSIGARRRQDITNYDGYVDAVIDEFKVSEKAKTSFYLTHNFVRGLQGLGSVEVGDLNLGPTNLIVLVPIDEKTGDTIETATYSYNINQIDGNVLTQFTNLTFSKNLVLTEGTNYFITLDIDTNVSAAYYGRTYAFIIPTGSAVRTLQPYLPPVPDSILTTVNTVSAVNLLAIPNQRIKVFKPLETGRTLIHESITDGKGQTAIPFIIADEYSLEVWSDANILLNTQNYTATATTTDFYFYIPDVNQVVFPEYTDIRVNFRPFIRSHPTRDLNVFIDINSDTNSVTAIQVIMQNNDVNIWVSDFDTNAFIIADGNGFQFNLNELPFHGIDTNYSVNFIVIVQLNTGQEMYFRDNSYLFERTQVFLLSTTFRSEMGCVANPNAICMPLMFLAFFISMLFAGGLSVTTIRNGQGFTILALLFLSAFTYLAWIPIGIFAAVAFTGFVAMAMMSRLN